MSALRGAIRHLTVLPLAWSEHEAALAPAAALMWFPLVGLGVGGLVAGVLLLPVPALPRAALAVGVWALLAGGLHEDGWMDCADAAFAVAGRERRLAILRDPHVGAHAVNALLVLLLVRFSALAQVPPVAAPIAAIAGRWTMTLTVARLRPARRDGLGAAFARDARLLPATVVALVCLGGLLPLAGPRELVAAPIGSAAGVLLAGWLSRRFGGVTGDVHGAAGLAAESTVLLVFACLQ